MLHEGEVGLDAGHGSSPGGTGRLFPDATLPTLAGTSLSLDSYRAQRDLVVLMLGGGSLPPAASYLLAQLTDLRAELEMEESQVIAIVADVPSHWVGEWPYPFPLAFDADARLHHRVAAIGDADQPEVALYITDRYREIFAMLFLGEDDWPTDARSVIEWLTFINIQCPECTSPETWAT